MSRRIDLDGRSLAAARPGRRGWRCLERGVHGGKGAVWAHEASGWIVRHCGHPTALWPYYAEEPGTGRWLLSGGFGLGYAFPTLAGAQEAVEQVIAGKCELDPARSARS